MCDELLKDYLKYRRIHLRLERQKVPFLKIPVNKREQSIRKLRARESELTHLIKFVHEKGLAEAAAYEKSKSEYLTKMKIAILKGEV